MSKLIVGLDLSLRNAGIAVIDSDVEPVQTFSIGFDLKNPTAHDHVRRNISITKGIISFIKKFHTDHDVYVAIENYAFAGHFLTKQAELAGLVKAQVYLNFGTPVIPIPSSTVRAFLLVNEAGSKNDKVKKKDLVEKFLRSQGFTNPANNDEFDALAVALVMKAYCCDRFEGTFNKRQKELFERIDNELTADAPPKLKKPVKKRSKVKPA